MEKNFFLISLPILLMFYTQLSGQNGSNYEPTTKWPYLYSEFMSGTVVFTNGLEVKKDLNIHLLYSNIHYLDGDKIIQANANDIAKVMIGDDVFLPMKDLSFAKLVKTDNDYSILLVVKGDIDALFTSKGAYGTNTTTASTNNLSSLQLGGLSNMNHRQLTLEKEMGQVFPVKQEWYFIYDRNELVAKSKEVMKTVSDQKSFKNFLKEEKLKWNNIEDLNKIMEYLKGHGVKW